VSSDLGVVATAGHVDHGKSSLIVRLTGIDPDRFAEEKRRGLTIDLGYAWCTLPSGREIGFVDVPGHERFIANMLAGVGPVRLVLFVVAADEGWRRQSEEHLQILDVLGVEGGVIALTKRDLVDDAALDTAERDIRAQVADTGLHDAPIVPVSSLTGDGIDALVDALDVMVAAAPAPPRARARLFVDRVFTIKGAGTVATGTLTGDCLQVGEDVELYPTGRRARIRALQTHRRPEDRACPVRRVAANLSGTERVDLARGAVLGRPGEWPPTDLFEARLRPVRGLVHPITPRGAFKVYAGAAEADATIRLLGAGSLVAKGGTFARIRLSRPLALDIFDRFVLRETGRRETVAGGVVLDVAPPARAGAGAVERLSARAVAAREDLPWLLADERGAVRVDEALVLTGAAPSEPPAGRERIGDWLFTADLRPRVNAAVREALEAFHAEHPLEEGAGLPTVREFAGRALTRSGAPDDPSLTQTILDAMASEGSVVRTSTTLRLASHRVQLASRSEDVDRLLAAIGGDQEPTPPRLSELADAGLGRDVIDAAVRAGLVVRVGADLVFTPAFVARAEELVRDAGAEGITVSAFRGGLATSRKYAVPLLEWFDQRGVTRREGDRRIARGAG
jgi:selenocysteine-specific elongation factor